LFIAQPRVENRATHCSGGKQGHPLFMERGKQGHPLFMENRATHCSRENRATHCSWKTGPHIVHCSASCEVHGGGGQFLASGGIWGSAPLPDSATRWDVDLGGSSDTHCSYKTGPPIVHRKQGHPLFIAQPRAKGTAEMVSSRRAGASGEARRSRIRRRGRTLVWPEEEGRDVALRGMKSHGVNSREGLARCECAGLRAQV